MNVLDEISTLENYHQDIFIEKLDNGFFEKVRWFQLSDCDFYEYRNLFLQKLFINQEELKLNPTNLLLLRSQITLFCHVELTEKISQMRTERWEKLSQMYVNYVTEDIEIEKNKIKSKLDLLNQSLLSTPNSIDLLNKQDEYIQDIRILKKLTENTNCFISHVT
jgi:hypothetical protein